MNKKKIAYITGTRADFGLMISVLKAIEESDVLELNLFATGMHLMSEYGNTVDQVKKQFPNTKIIPVTFSSNDRIGVARFTGEYLQELVKHLNKGETEIVLILGDRVEMLCTALAATYLGIPTAHIHGGEKTSTIDELARHAITKLASLHLAATEESAERIRKMGEEEWRIRVVGAPALDFILNERLPSRKEVFQKLGLNIKEKVVLVIQHPVSEQEIQAGKQMEETLVAVKSFNLPVIVIFPNADPGARSMIEVIEREKRNPLISIFESLEYKDFLALEREAAIMVGNSSAGIIESASFYLPVVNVGIRQLGREQSGNVINVNCDAEEIRDAIKKSLYDKLYRKKIQTISNVWGDGRAAEQIVKELESLEIRSKLLTKQISY